MMVLPVSDSIHGESKKIRQEGGNNCCNVKQYSPSDAAQGEGSGLTYEEKGQ